MAFDIIAANAGSGGANFAFDTFTDTDSASKTMPYSALAFGALNGPYTVVNTGAGLPCTLQASSAVIGHVIIDSGTITLPTGAATSANQATEIASLASIDGKITAVNTGAVVVSSSALPSGASTSALQTTGNTSLSSIDGKITACNTGAVVISSGSVTADTELTTADLDTGAGTDTRAVVGLALAASGGALLVGSANPMPISDNSGSITVDNAGTFAVQAAQSGTWNITNVSGTVSLPTGAATAAKQPALGTAGTASADVITVQGIASMTALKVDGSAVTQPVSGTVTATIAAGASTIAKAEDVASADADVGVPAMAVRKATPANTSGTDGDYEFLQMSAGRLWVSGVIDTALPAGTNAIGKLASNTGVTIGAVEIASAQTLATVTNVATIGTSVTPGTSAAHLGKAEDAAAASGDTGVFVLGVRNETLTSPTGTDGDYSQFSTGSAGEVVVQQAPLSAHVAGTATTTGTSDTSLVAAQGASTYYYCTAFSAVNTGSTAALITFKDGSGGSTLFYAIVPAGGGCVMSGGGKPLFKTSANTALYFAAGSSSTTIYLSASGFKSKV